MSLSLIMSGFMILHSERLAASVNVALVSKACRTACLLASFAIFAAFGSGKEPSGVEFSKAGYWEVEGSPRKVTSINQGWEFSLDAFETAKCVSLPHSIDEGEIGFEASGGVNRQQPAWYRRKFVWEGGGAHQFLHFEAIMGKCRIKLNGRLVAEHFGGFLPIHAEITDALRRGENLLEVWCDNSNDPTYPPGKPQELLDFSYFGGIYRDAYLIETSDAYVTSPGEGGVYVTSRMGTNGVWTVLVDVALAGRTEDVETRLYYDGNSVVSPFCPKYPAVWSPEEPNLHFLRVDVCREGRVIDSVGVRFGIRDFRLDENGLTLNGCHYNHKLIGVNRHQDYLFIGMALPNSLHWRDVKKYKDCGMTVFRNAHYPQDPAFMDACDELGVFVIVNTPGWQFWNDKDSVFERRVYDDIRQMVRRDRSRPSLLMWEPILNETHFPGCFVTNAVRIVKSETREPNYCACDGNSPGSAICDVNYGVSSDPKKPLFCREWGDFPDNWNAQNSSSRVAREWGETPQVVQARHYMSEPRWAGLKEQLSRESRHFGGTLWHGADHARGYHPDNFLGGILTYGRQKKYSWHAFKAALTAEPYVYLAHELAACSPGEMIVFSNCPYRATWLGEPYIAGSTAFSYDAVQSCMYGESCVEKVRFEITLPNGTKSIRRPAARFSQIELMLDTEGLAPVADGSDLVAVVATLSDQDGVPRRYSRERVVFDVAGPARIVGDNPQEVRWGEAIVLIRPDAVLNPQPITVTARLTRKGECLGQSGELTFVPGTCGVTTRHGAVDENLRRKQKDVGRQQADFATGTVDAQKPLSIGDFTNPVIPVDWPDPSVWDGRDGWFYSVATSLMTIRRSRNLTEWEDMNRSPLTDEARRVLTNITCNVWAPSVVRIGGSWMLYVSLQRDVSDCRIAVLSSDSPSGPFSYRGIVIESRKIGILNTIDPYVFEDEGRVWMTFGSCQDGVHLVELGKDGLAVRPGAEPVHLAGLRHRADVPMWGRPGTYEGSYVLRRGDWWYLFVSGGLFNDGSYYLTVGRSKDIAGDYRDQQGHSLRDGLAKPILCSAPGDRFVGVGHNGDVFTSSDGRDWMFVHAHDETLADKSARPTLLKQIHWSADGWPGFTGGR